MMDINRDHMMNSLRKGLRFDGRKLEEIREPFSIQYGVSKTAEGSALVTMGKSVVMAGIKMELTTPYPDTPKQGALMVNAELIPMSSSEYEPGPPTEKGIEISRVIDKALRESKAIDLEKLCVVEGEKVWMIIVDIVPINDDGNLIDVGTIAAMAALKDAKLPLVLESGAVDYKQKTEEKIPINHAPLSVTIHKIGKYFVVDSVNAEEKYTGARLTVAINERNNPCALQKGGQMPLTLDEINHMVDLAIKTSNEYRKKLE